MNTTYRTTEQVNAEKLTAAINAENKRLKREGTREDAINLLKAAGILTKSGNVAKPYRA